MSQVTVFNGDQDLVAAFGLVFCNAGVECYRDAHLNVHVRPRAICPRLILAAPALSAPPNIRAAGILCC